MSQLPPYHSLYDKPFHEDIRLSLPLTHLLGHRMGIHLKESNKLDISFWRFEENSSPYTGRIHIMPELITDELMLIEDFVRADEKPPKDFPMIFERTTEAQFVNTSLSYPASNEKWNFRIHYKNPDVKPFIDSDCRYLIAEGRLARSHTNPYHFEDWERHIYNPPREFAGREEIRRPILDNEKAFELSK